MKDYKNSNSNSTQNYKPEFLKLCSQVKNGLTAIVVVWMMAGCRTGEPKIAAEDHYLFKNISKNAAYVGSKVCRSCHSDIYETFMQTGMGRSLYEPFETNTVENYEHGNIIYDRKSNFYYRMYEENGKYFQEEFRKNAAGNKIYSRTKEVKYVVGSGNSVRSYITENNGLVYQMPVSWYTKKKIWDLSPGYHRHNQRFSRVIVQECIGCHNAYVDFVKGSVNRYRLPFPEGIGCERCHGPGELHAAKHLKNSKTIKTGKLDSTIVNPARLNRDENLDVCYQCHLQGEMFVAKRDKDEFDFRPGTRLKTIRSVMVNTQADSGFTIASHPERLRLSTCFKKSAMTCTTCHDPHISVYQTQRSSFNQKCQTCHSADKIKVTLNHTAESNCVSCHMKQGGTSNIPHVNFTDHWIQRRIPKNVREYVPEEMATARSDDSTMVELEDFFEEDSTQLELRLGISYYKIFYNKKRFPNYLKRAINHLEKAVMKDSLSVDAHAYLGMALHASARFDDALKEFAAVTRLDSTFPKIHYWTGFALLAKQKYEPALLYFQKAMANNPSDAVTLLNIANCYHFLRRYDQAKQYYLQSINADSNYTDAYINLALNYFAADKPNEAETAYFQALQIDPDLYDAYFGLGNIRFARNDFKGAVGFYENALAVDPQSVPALANLGYVYLNGGDIPKARNYLLKALSLNPSDVRIRQLLAETKQSPIKK